MEKRILGKTNLNVSVVGLGGIPLQRLTEDEAIKIVKYSIDKGVNFIDTARGYSVSEMYIGKAIKEIRDKDIEKILSDDGAYKALLEAKEAGRIGHIGITGHTADLLLDAINTEKFETVQFPFNVIENQGIELFTRAKELNMGTIVMKPIAGGAFEKGELSIKYILNKEFIDSAIPGMDTLEIVDRNTEVGNNLTELTDEERIEIEKESNEIGKEFCRRCGYCLPCTQGIDIPSQFVLESYLKRYNLADWARERYQKIEINASNCIECGECEIKCPYNLPIIKMLKKVDKSFN